MWGKICKGGTKIRVHRIVYVIQICTKHVFRFYIVYRFMLVIPGKVNIVNGHADVLLFHLSALRLTTHPVL